MMGDSSAKWSKTEENALKTFFPRHGHEWDGWDEVLPNRSEYAILKRARFLGLSPGRLNEAKQMKPDPYESYVVECMRMGMAPSDIDRQMKWFKGTACLIMSNRWKRLRESFEKENGDR